MQVFEWLPGGQITSTSFGLCNVSIDGDFFTVTWNAPFYLRTPTKQSRLVSHPHDGLSLQESGISVVLGQTLEKITFEDRSFIFWMKENVSIVVPFDDLECGYVVDKRGAGQMEILFM